MLRMLPPLRIFIVLLLMWSPQTGTAVTIAYEDCVALSAPVRTSLDIPNCTQPTVACKACGKRVEVDKLYHITKLNMSSNSLNDTLPAQWSELKALTYLGISFNRLSGTLPTQWSKLKALVNLEMSDNVFTGTLPPPWSELSALANMDISLNALTGTLPAQWSELKALSYLDISSNFVTFALPRSWSELKSLARLNMSTNYLSGMLPTPWSELKALSNLDMSANSLYGTLPTQWSELKALANLDMSTNNFSGTLPTRWSELKALANLDMSSNNFNKQRSKLKALANLGVSANSSPSGTLPSQWSNLVALAMNLGKSANSLSGTLPTPWSELKALTHLGMSANSLNGTLPTQWSQLKALANLDVSANSLSGTLPAQWSHLKALANLDMSANSLSGPLPTPWSELKALVALDMSSNSLSGTVPPQWSELKVVTYLAMFSNSLNGTLPTEWSKLKALANLVMFSNNLTGTLPAQWSELKALDQLYLSDNNLSGQVPPGWSNLKAKIYLSCTMLNEVVMESWGPIVTQVAGLSMKDVNGTLPTRLSKLSNLQYLNVTEAKLYGPLPLWVSQLTALAALDMSHNHFTGTLPVAWAKLRSLSSLTLSNNSINGTMPVTWNNLTSLTSLDLSNNYLTGTIPAAWNKLTSLTLLDTSNNQLTGPMPAAWNKLTGLTSLDLSKNHLTGTLPQAWSKIFSSQPSQFNDFASLAILKLASNNIRGPIPSAWLTNSTWWNTFVYIDVSNNQLTGMLPQLPANIQFLNTSSNSFTGPLPPIPPSLVYLHVGRNNLSGTVPGVTNSSMLTFMDISSNRFLALPTVFQAPRAIFLNASDNHMQGPLPSHGYNHSLVYCDLSRNHFSGPVPAVWHNHTWSYLALDNNSLTGNLPSWSGHAEILLLQNNSLSGCVLPDVSQLRGTKVLSISSNNITCLTVNWSTTLTSLFLLDVSHTLARLVPLEWVEEISFAREQTVLRLGSLWKSSAKHSRRWRRSVCMRKDLNDKLSRSLNYTTLPQGIQDRIQDQINQGLVGLSRSLRSLNVTNVMFDVGPLQLRLGDNLPNLTRDDICGNKLARPIVIIQYSLLCSAIVAMVTLYWVESRWHLLSNCGSRRGASCLALDIQQRHVAKVVCAWSIIRSGKFLVSLLLYWLDVVSDIVLITQVWQFTKAWPGYVLLGILLVHYAVALVSLAWRAHITTLNKTLLLVFGMPFVPLLDTTMFVFLVFEQCLPAHRSSIFASAVMVQWEAMFEMREVLEVCIEAVPTSVFQSTIFLLGNRPDLGWFLDTRVYIVSAMASLAQIVRMVGVILWESTRDDVAPWTILWRKFSWISNNQSNHGQRVALNTTGNTADGESTPSAHDIRQGLEQL